MLNLVALCIDLEGYQQPLHLLAKPDVNEVVH